MKGERDSGAPVMTRPLPKRTYGAKQGTRRAGRLNEEQDVQTQVTSLTSTAEDKHQQARDGGDASQLAGVSSKELSLPSEAATDRLESATAYSSRRCRYYTAAEISKLVLTVTAGGDDGRSSAIALAQALKSRESRRAMLATSGGGIVKEMTEVMLASVRADGNNDRGKRDDAIIHCLAVAMFIASKDRAMAKWFNASVVSLLAVLVERKRGVAVLDNLSAESAMVSAADTMSETLGGGASTVLGRSAEPTSSKMVLIGTTSKEGRGRVQQGRDAARDHHSEEGSKGSVFDMSDEDDDYVPGSAVDGTLGGASDVRSRGPANIVEEPPHRSLVINDSSDTIISASPLPTSQALDHGSANVMMRARMLLDITDMLPWGIANRHLISAADLGLAAVLNVAAQACSSEDEREAGGDGNSLEDESDTQDSERSQSGPSDVVGEALTEVGVGSSAAGNTAGVMPELRRVGPSGFLLALIVEGAAILGEMVKARTDCRGAGGNATAGSSWLRAIHRLLLALRLLDLATLDRPSEADSTGKGADIESLTSAVPRTKHAQLVGALLLIVSRSQSLCTHAGATGGRIRFPMETRGGRVGRGSGKQSARGQPQSIGDEVSARIHKCLLASLRVLINVTHHDARACEEVAQRGGLSTLMSCLLTHSKCASGDGRSCDGDGDSPVSWRRRRMSSEGLFSDGFADEVGVQSNGASVGGFNDIPHDEVKEESSGAAGGDFDAQILALGALINCVELKASAANCAAMASLDVYQITPVVKHAGKKEKPNSIGKASKCFAPEFLARLLVHCTKGFEKQLEVKNAEEDEPSSPAPVAQRGNARDVSSGIDSSTQLISHGNEAPMAPVATPELEGEEVMSHDEGADLVLGGHCALLLGLLVREHERNRRLAFCALPDGAATLIVRVLEAFMALQYQAGVLTAQVVLAVQRLVEELEGIEALSEDEPDAFEFEGDDAAAAQANIPSPSPCKGRKRQRSPTILPLRKRFSTPKSGQWDTGDDGDDDADDFSLSGPRPQPGVQPEDRRVKPKWLPKIGGKVHPRPPDASNLATPSSPVASILSDPDSASRSRPKDTRSDQSTPVRQERFSASERKSWRVGGTPGGISGSGMNGGITAGSRSWLGRSPRTYGRQGAYSRRTWKARPLAGFRSPIHDNVSAATQQPKAPGETLLESAIDTAVSDASDDMVSYPIVKSSGGGKEGSGVGPRSGRSNGRGLKASTSVFNLDCLSDSSFESPLKSSNPAPCKSKRMSGVTVESTCCASSGRSDSGGTTLTDSGTRDGGSRREKGNIHRQLLGGSGVDAVTLAKRPQEGLGCAPVLRTAPTKENVTRLQKFGPYSGGARSCESPAEESAPNRYSGETERGRADELFEGATSMRLAEGVIGSAEVPIGSADVPWEIGHPPTHSAAHGTSGRQNLWNGKHKNQAGCTVEKSARGSREAKRNTASKKGSTFDVDDSGCKGAESSGAGRSVFDLEDESD